MTFQTHKCPNAQSDVIQHRTQPAALCAFNQTLLFQTAMIHFNPPCRESKFLTLRFAHPDKARRPVFRCAVCGANPKYFDFSKSLEPHECPISAAQAGFRDCLQFALTHSDLPIRFEPSQKMPPQSANQFEVFDRSVPAIETNQFGIKAALACLEQHFRKVVIFGFAVAALQSNTR